MKIKTILKILIVFLVFTAVACDPIVDEDILQNITDIDGVELVATQSTPGGNGITLKMATPGVTGYWDYNIGRAFSDEASFVYPIPGNNTFTFTGSLGAEFFTKTIDVQIDVLDQPLDQDWYDLVGENTTQGKTWIFNQSVPFWYMIAPNNIDGWEGLWWNAGECCINDGQENGSMTFNLDGAANYIRVATTGAAPETGSFVLDVANQKLTLSGVKILGDDANRANPDGVYDIIRLTDTELILHNALTPAGDSGWVWRFVAEE
ncbi:hypothetical protein EGM88_01705 [Aureibaculum marinum]|uniref:Lipocalin-like domain-containing protein n=1 Tax=Aureibaculum marinum TaxID=2487930 RepID=A0A3N4NZK8_9FLAO|nr:hypothetical protein [Aureibaculum marinum]RPE00258.1 hypothetical protein EGM88_01705 [Aureibaculum marinum]